MRELTVFFELWTKPFGIFRCFLTERFNDKYIHSFILRRQDSCTDGGAIIEECNFGRLVLGGENISSDGSFSAVSKPIFASN